MNFLSTPLDQLLAFCFVEQQSGDFYLVEHRLGPLNWEKTLNVFVDVIANNAQRGAEICCVENFLRERAVSSALNKNYKTFL